MNGYNDVPSETESLLDSFTFLIPTAANVMVLKNCTECGQLKTQEEMVKNRCKCRACKNLKNKDLRQRYKDHNYSEHYVRPDTNWCHICKEDLPVRYFVKDASRKSGFTNRCKYHDTLRQLEQRKLAQDNIMTKEQFFMILNDPCHYCNSNEDIGVDRLDNTRTYHYMNCVACCKTCNIMKHTMSSNDFVKHILKLSKNILQ